MWYLLDHALVGPGREFGAGWGLVVFGVLIAIGIAALVAGRRLADGLLLAGPMLAPILIGALLSQQQSILAARYVIVCMGPALVLVAIGAESSFRRWLRKPAPFTLLLTLAVMVVWLPSWRARFGQGGRPAFSETAMFLRDELGAGEIVITGSRLSLLPLAVHEPGLPLYVLQTPDWDAWLPLVFPGRVITPDDPLPDATGIFWVPSRPGPEDDALRPRLGADWRLDYIQKPGVSILHFLPRAES